MPKRVSKPVFVQLLLPYVGRFWFIYFCLALVLLAGIADGLLFTWFFQTITNAAVSGDESTVRTYFALGSILVIVMMTVQYMNMYLESLATSKVKTSLANDLFAHLIKLPTRYYTSHHSGDLVARMTQDVGQIGGAIGGNLLSLIRQPLWAAASFAYLVTIHPPLALIALMLGPLTAVLAHSFGRLMRRNGRHIQELTGKQTEYVNDSFAGHLVIRAFGLESDRSRGFRRQNDRLRGLQLKEGRLKAGLQAGSTGISIAAQIIVLGIGSLLIVRQELSIGELVAFISLTQGLIGPFSSMAGTWAGFQRSLAAAERIFQVMREPAAIQAPSAATDSAPALTDGIRYENVSFAYDTNRTILKHFDLYIPAGKTVAFVGPSGAGKSTVFNLTLGLYEVNAGMILIDGQRLGESADRKRNYLSLVPQETFLFSGSIRSNIALGRSGATDEDITQAAIAAEAHRFIMELPQGYETEVGERGIRLSGGQKQKISIARALLRNAPVLLLDEATSALDSESEASIQRALRTLMQNRTTLVIAHRLSTVLDVDLIVVMDQGRIAEMGNHLQLLEQGGLYASMFAIQYREYMKAPAVQDLV
ncbi:ABC transporter ATP-binding protein [Paenibacillus ginsengarvi]|uniref:ABC transporter ATP-binding protein n=1 Tax=Paenibacillus ginsengarvi TaxID=400777 RepID=A0A3B0C798_9BACL|nr:ABC transporter ATP-binding protein [Paenibacillus ginsengarvi]RKN82035.1 ABC transporter ATP-binding protein [Paenibacillus ginsengarvi]